MTPIGAPRVPCPVNTDPSTPLGEARAFLSRHPFYPPLTILPIDTNGYIPSQSVDLPIMTNRGRRRIPQSRLVRMIRDEAGWIMPENDCEAVAEFIRTKGITRCPTACVLPTQGLVAAADRIALEEHAIARDQFRRAQTAARWRPF